MADHIFEDWRKQNGASSETRDERCDRRGFAEDPATDCDADDERRSASKPDDAPEILRR